MRDTILSRIDETIESHILRINFIEFLTGYLEKRVSIEVVLQINERIYSRDPSSLSQVLISSTQKIHEIKKRKEKGEDFSDDMLTNSINEILLELVEYQEQEVI